MLAYRQLHLTAQRGAVRPAWVASASASSSSSASASARRAFQTGTVASRLRTTTQQAATTPRIDLLEMRTQRISLSVVPAIRMQARFASTSTSTSPVSPSSSPAAPAASSRTTQHLPSTTASALRTPTGLRQLALNLLVLERTRLVSPSRGVRFASTDSKTESAATSASASSTTPAAPSSSTQTTPAPATATPAVVAKKDPKSDQPFLTRAWTTVKKEAAHYWAGTKLLGKEIAISSKITKKVLNGGQLTRRERRQLRRTTTDLLRLIPFSVFLLVPFMEILLPVALKLFPNMLPSTFEGKLAADEKQRKLLRVRIEMAKFLQETISESGLKAEGVVNSQEFKEFFRKVRSTGESASPEDVIKVAKQFQDDITLDNLSRPQLVSMCRYMNINAFGTDNFLKHQIRARLEKIRVDDMMIHAEGIDALSTKELQQACQSRGIRTSGVSPSRLREELAQWIDLHYTNGISGVLLVLSRAFHFDQTGESVFKSLEATLSSLPDNLLSEAELKVLGDTSTYKQKLEVLQQQQELIEDEAEQEQEEEEAREQAKREKKEREEQTKLEEDAKKAEELTPADETAENKPAAVAEADARMTKEQLGELAEALSILSAKSSIVKERDELKQLMEHNITSEEESKLRPEETESPQVSLNKRIRSMIKKIDSQLESYDERVGSSLNTIQCNANGQISLADLKKALTVIKHKPDDNIIEAVVKKLDVDQDGYVVLDHVLELTQDTGLGIVVDDDAQHILKKGAKIKEDKPKREDIIAD